LTVVGQIKDVVMGLSSGASDNGMETAPDFEFVPDWPII
jgi:hypothetical protein